MGVAGAAVGQTCYCCSPFFGWGDGSSDPAAYPCEPGFEVLTCEVGAYPNYTGECADGVRQRICYSFHPSTGLNVIHAACGQVVPGFIKVGPPLNPGAPVTLCCFVDEETYATGGGYLLPGPGILNCAGDC